jgi:hypothetical protein
MYLGAESAGAHNLHGLIDDFAVVAEDRAFDS